LAGPVVAAACVAIPPEFLSDAKFPEGVRDSKTVSEEEREALFPKLLSSPLLAFGVSVLDHAAIDSVNIFAATMLAMERATAAARETAMSRLGLAVKATTAALPVEDRIVYSAAGAAAPPSLSSPPQGIHPLMALHTVFVDGPHCPPRIAAATDGDVFTTTFAQGKLKGKKRGRGEDPTSPIPVPGRKPFTTVNTSVDIPLPERLGPIYAAQPVIGGDSKVYTIAAASLVAKVTRDRLMREYGARWPAYGFSEHKGYGTRDHMAAIATHGPCPIHRRTFAPLKFSHPVGVVGTLSVEASKSKPLGPKDSRGGSRPRKK